MDKFIAQGGVPLKGTVTVNGSKNAALPILIASLLTDGECVARRVPPLRDIRAAQRLLEALGKKTVYENNSVRILPGRRLSTAAPYDLVRRMRASVLVAGPLLARFHEARVPLPGGCAIGLRPVDIHLKGFEKLGAKIITGQGDLLISARKLRGAKIKFPFPSVGATENIMLCAALAQGVTVIENAALEPEIDDLAACLNSMGASVRRAPGGKIVIEGAPKLSGFSHDVMADRIEAGTYLIAVAASGGKAQVRGCVPEHLKAALSALKKSGAKLKINNGVIAITGPARPAPVSVKTLPYPGFPTDLQALWMAYMCRARGASVIKETIFENRFMHAAELSRMGARISVRGGAAVVDGVDALSGASVMASDLRGGAALTVAAVCAAGESVIRRVYHIDRGYRRLEEGLRALGAKIRRASEEM
ncbi:MAG: UDP-N-acetylglucosamine 1-carboxyvinyltransferase [Elusimicrobiales bacterium]|nr:UDP-N-acetylglucosamine 1-carboxyvinyltransferase [Elusimicrobiales bacterium]